jgi:ATP phosphoribosyltransferase regulatory subunit HisZ
VDLLQGEIYSTLTTRAENFLREFSCRRVLLPTFLPQKGETLPEDAILLSGEQGNFYLRYDPTVQINLLLSRELPHLPLPLKVYYIERSYKRKENGYREGLQLGMEWVGVEGEPYRTELFQLLSRMIESWISTKVILILGDARFKTLWEKNLSLSEEQWKILQKKDGTTWKKEGSPSYPYLPFLLVKERKQIPQNLPSELSSLIEEWLEFMETLPSQWIPVVDPIRLPPTPYYHNLFFLAGCSIPGDPWLRGGEYKLNHSVPSMGFTIDLHPLISAILEDSIPMVP